MPEAAGEGVASSGMLEDSETSEHPRKGGLWPRRDGAPEGRVSKAVQILQAAALGWCAVALIGLPMTWVNGSLFLLALCVWLGDPTRARYPSVMLAAFAAGAVGALWRPLQGGPAWERHPEMGEITGYLPVFATIVLTGYGAARPPRKFFGGPMLRALLRRGLLVALAAAVGFQLTGLWRLGSRLGLGTPEDELMLSAVSACLVAIGGIAFGRLFTRTSELHVAAALGVSSLGSFAALAIVGGISTPRGFRALCERFGSDASLAGTAIVDTAVASTIGVLPLMALGAAIHMARDRGALAAVILGLFVGQLQALHSIPWTFDSIAEATQALGSAALPKQGAVAAGVLLAAMAFAARGPKKMAVAGLALAALGVFVPVSSIPILQPWSRFPVQPEAVFETRHGQFTIQSDGAGRLQVLLDQRPLLPGPDEEGMDRAAIVHVYETWQAYRLRKADEAGQPAAAIVPLSVMAIGIVSPERAAVLAELGITELDRGTVFPEVAPLLERRLFEAAGLAPHGIPAGRHESLYPLMAGERWAAGAELWIPLLPGALSSSDWFIRHGLESADDFVLSRSWDRKASILDEDAPSWIDFATDGLRAVAARPNFWISPPSLIWPWTPWAVERGGPTVLDWLRIRPDERSRAGLRLMLSRMSPPQGRELFHQGFVEFAKIQRVGSPFETPDERVFLNERALSLWREFAIAQAELLGHERSMLEGAADALRAQGEIEWIQEFLQPIADAHSPWPRLEETIQWASDQSRPAGRLAIISIMPRLTQLLAQAEGATMGVITAREAREVDPGDGAPLIFTGLTVRGTDLATGTPEEVQVWFPGGIVDEDTGSFTADGPKRHGTRIGRGAIVFHRHSDDMGGGLAGDVLVGGAAGLLNTFSTSDKRTLVLGKGQDGPSSGNISAEELRSRFRALSGSPPNPPR